MLTYSICSILQRTKFKTIASIKPRWWYNNKRSVSDSISDLLRTRSYQDNRVSPKGSVAETLAEPTYRVQGRKPP
ncbi:protein of unknown function [Serratia sp. Tan611]|nr:protein of unknown function [Serratia sp. Tan611]